MHGIPPPPTAHPDAARQPTARTPELAEAPPTVLIHPVRSAPQAVAEVLTGAAAGAALGAMVGPPGIVAGALLGGLVGAAAEVMLDRDRARAAQHDAELDTELGVIDGYIGEASANQAAPRLGVYSAATATLSGSAARASQPSEGPFQNVDAA